MADEAVVRIVTSREGGDSASQAPAPTSTGSAPVTQQQQQQQPQQQPPPSRDWVNDLVNGIAGANRHVLIEGQSGSGKSLLTRHVAFERMQKGEEVNVLDTHTPESWAGAKNVFSGTNQQAGADMARLMEETLAGRKQEAQEAKVRGEQPQFKDVTFVLSDFARLAKDSPALVEAFRTITTEGRKFGMAVVAETTALTAAATNIKGIQDIRSNLAQHVQLAAPTAVNPQRTATVGSEKFVTPDLPDYSDRVDYSLVKPPPPPRPAVDPDEQERKEAESRARLLATIARLDREAAKERETEAAKEAAEQIRRDQTAAASRARLTARVIQLDREAATERKKTDETAAAERKRLQEADPYYQADKRRQAERRSAQVQAAYKEKYGGDEGGTLGKILDAANQFRGVIGGAGGVVIGAILDTTAAIRNAKASADKGKRDRQLISEATSAAKNVGGSGGGSTAAATAATAVATEGEAAAGAAVGLEALAAAAGPVGIVLATIGVVGGIAVKAFNALTQEVDEAAKKYGEYSAQIAGAQAQAEALHIQGNIQRAQQLAPEMTKYIAAQATAQEELEDIKVAILEKLIPIATSIYEATAAVAKWSKEMVNIENDKRDVSSPTDALLYDSVFTTELNRDSRTGYWGAIPNE